MEGRGPQERRPLPTNPPKRQGKGNLGEMAWIAALVVAGSLLAALVLVRMLRQVGAPQVRVIEAPHLQGAAKTLDPETLAADVARIDEIVRWLAAPERAGRDTPSLGLQTAQDYVAQQFESLGLAPAADSNTLWEEAGTGGAARRKGSATAFLRPFAAESVEFGRVPIERPSPEGCALEVPGAGPFELGRDFVPLAGTEESEDVFGGSADAPLVFAGFGIDNDASGYDDFAFVNVGGKIAIVLGGEPRWGDAPNGPFEGPVESAEASWWNKLDALRRHGAVGALLVRTEAEPPTTEGLSFHATRASWVPPTFDKVRAGLPALEISRATAERLLGAPPKALEDEINGARAPLPPGRLAELRASGALGTRSVLRAATERSGGLLYNVVGFLRGTSPSPPCLIVGAHLDHIGVGPRGRIAYGADDNASGVAALLRAAELLAASPPSYSILFCVFTGEEDGLLGSKALSIRLPPDIGPVIAMVNLDMIGRGDTRNVAVLRGARDGPRLAGLNAAIEAALEGPATQPDSALGHSPADSAGGPASGPALDRIQLVHDPSFFRRSDHYSFYEVGIPSIFLFEGWPHRVGVYHTWMDTPDTLNMEKIARTMRYLLALLSNLGKP